MPRTRAFATAAVLLALAAASARAAGLDVTAEHRLRGLSYSNTNLTPGAAPGQRSFLSQSTRLGLTLKNIDLGAARGETQTLDIVLKLRAVGVQGSTTPLASPFDRAAAHYPSVAYTPFFENAALVAHRLGGIPWDVTFGRQTYTMGSGLLLDDNDAGLAGVSARGTLPWWGMKAEGFVFQAAHPMQGGGAGAGSLDLAGWSLELPSEGTWQLSQLLERDRRTQLAAPNGCPATPGGPGFGCLVGKATRVITSLRYHLRYGPLVFDGEGAWQKGAASPTGAAAAGNHITYNGNAQVFKAKWRQTFYRSKETGRKIEGLARMSFARGSGDDPATATTDEAFFPSWGRRFDGLEREGFGEYFAATPYDVFGPARVVAGAPTASALPAGVSGVIALGFGATPPAWHGLVLDVDQYLYQADRAGATRGLGKELDVRLRHDIRDRFSLKLSAAFYSTGSAINASKPSARRYLFEASGRF